jgi:hypothetical protein
MPDTPPPRSRPRLTEPRSRSVKAGLWPPFESHFGARSRGDSVSPLGCSEAPRGELTDKPTTLQ